MSTPWISETIKELERQLKVTLFVRTTRSVQLTDAGRVFASLLSHVLDDLDDAVRVAQRMTARSGRALTLGYVIGAGLELVPRLVRTYLERRPDQPLRSVEYDFADPTAGLRDHDVDAAIVRPPLGLAGIATLELITEPRVACLPDSHRLARRESVSVSELLLEPIIAAPSSPGPWRGYWLLDEYRTGPAPSWPRRAPGTPNCTWWPAATASASPRPGRAGTTPGPVSCLSLFPTYRTVR